MEVVLLGFLMWSVLVTGREEAEGRSESSWRAKASLFEHSQGRGEGHVQYATPLCAELGLGRKL